MHTLDLAGVDDANACGVAIELRRESTFGQGEIGDAVGGVLRPRAAAERARWCDPLVEKKRVT